MFTHARVGEHCADLHHKYKSGTNRTHSQKKISHGHGAGISVLSSPDKNMQVIQNIKVSFR